MNKLNKRFFKRKFIYLSLFLAIFLSIYEPLLEVTQSVPVISTSTSIKTELGTTTSESVYTVTETSFNIQSSKSTSIQLKRSWEAIQTMHRQTHGRVKNLELLSKSPKKANIPITLDNGQNLIINTHGTMSKVEIFYLGKDLVYKQEIYKPDRSNYFEPNVYRDATIQYKAENSGKYIIRFTVELTQMNRQNERAFFPSDSIYGVIEVSILIGKQDISLSFRTHFEEIYFTTKYTNTYIITLTESWSTLTSYIIEKTSTPFPNYLSWLIILLIIIIIVTTIIYHFRKQKITK